MNTKLRIGLGAMLGMWAVALGACQNDLEQIKAFEKLATRPAIEILDLKTEYVVKGRLKGRMETPRITMHNSNPDEAYYEFEKGLKVDFYNETGAFESRITTNYAKYFVKTRIWEARYNVKAVNTKGDTLQSEHVYIDEQKKQIYTQERVQITSADGMRIVGQDGFTSNIDFTEYKFKRVTGIFNVKLNQTDPFGAAQSPQP